MFDTLLDSERLRLVVTFQPVVDLRSDTVVGYEALGRVRQRPGDDSRPPCVATLIEHAHRSGRLADLERVWQRRAVVAFAAAQPLAAGSLFLPLDPRVLADPCFRLDDLSRLLWEHGLGPHRVVLQLPQVTTSAAGLPLEALAAHYRQAGFCVAAGASLACLVELRPDVVVLDGEVGRGLAADLWRQRVTAAIADCCRGLGVDLIVKGLDTWADVGAARAAGAAFGQGVALGRPQPTLITGHAAVDSGEPLTATQEATAA